MGMRIGSPMRRQRPIWPREKDTLRERHEHEGVAMWTTVLPYVLVLMGFKTFAAGGLALMWLLLGEGGGFERVSLRSSAVVATMISGGLGLIGMGQALRLLLLVLAKP